MPGKHFLLSVCLSMSCRTFQSVGGAKGTLTSVQSQCSANTGWQPHRKSSPPSPRLEPRLQPHREATASTLARRARRTEKWLGRSVS